MVSQQVVDIFGSDITIPRAYTRLEILTFVILNLDHMQYNCREFNPVITLLSNHAVESVSW
jgi:hypothetical protein